MRKFEVMKPLLFLIILLNLTVPNVQAEQAEVLFDKLINDYMPYAPISRKDLSLIQQKARITLKQYDTQPFKAYIKEGSRIIRLKDGKTAFIPRNIFALVIPSKQRPDYYLIFNQSKHKYELLIHHSDISRIDKVTDLNVSPDTLENYPPQIKNNSNKEVSVELSYFFGLSLISSPSQLNRETSSLQGHHFQLSINKNKKIYPFMQLSSLSKSSNNQKTSLVLWGIGAGLNFSKWLNWEISLDQSLKHSEEINFVESKLKTNTLSIHALITKPLSNKFNFNTKIGMSLLSSKLDSSISTTPYDTSSNEYYYALNISIGVSYAL